MLQRRMILSAAVLMSATALSAGAQNQAPFTIRRPPDGATVREKVKVQIPLASIPEGGYVSIYVDGDFRGAIPVTSDEREKITDEAEKTKSPAYFTYVWDSKAPVKIRFAAKPIAPKDGSHEIMARLYGPVEKNGTSLKETTSVKVNLANSLESNVGAIRLYYKFVDGDNRGYSRTGASTLVAGLSQNVQGSEDQELVSYNSDLAYGVEDRYPSGSAIVRNKMNRLEVRQGGSVSVYPSEQLPSALFQEVDQFGDVIYQNHSVSFDQFAQMGIPVSATLELPKLPKQAVNVGDKWSTPNVSLEIPGTAEADQPKVTVNSTFAGVEWEGGYPTARIHQSYQSSLAGGLKAKSITLGTTTITSPSITMEEDIYIAYRSGTLVKVTKTLTVTGKTDTGVVGGGMGGPGMAGGGGPVGADGGGSMPAGMGSPGMMGRGSGMSQGMAGGGRGSGMSQGMAGGRRGGSSMGFGGPGMAGGGGSPRGGQGMAGGGSSRGMGGKGGMMMGGGGPAGGGSSMGGQRGSFGAATGSTPNPQITMKLVTNTELKSPANKAGL
ncbi:MAG: hypothetical protein ABJA67_02345 [Chthonomonadales bacterium]